MSKALTAAAIAAAIADMPKSHTTMPHPSLGGDINIKIHTCAEREEFEQKVYGADSQFKDYPNRAVVFAHAVVDDKGDRLFDDKQIPTIANWPAHITMPVFNKYNELNLIGPGKVAAAEKN